ncbi:hypothetical protein AS156_14210 [Bradyrhizobium macuxiense]|uniref:Uncharacterized protein n=1 Tax=Bradyrhizobium macuxiense TaxID=1755647 RepID=A0A109JKF3_9BRAD|nr:hypothetical protein [Bradyrhizobium macuxiense]KWV50476.1 hypothetical protein AS156_14210 [Bradyrhizobium macuxiense]
MALIVPALSSGLCIGAVGIATIPELSWRSKALCVGVAALSFSGIGGFLYWHFQPKASDGASVLTPIGPSEASKDGSHSQLVSTVGKSFFKCTRPKTPDTRDLKRARAEAKQNMRAIGEKLGLSVDLRDIANGVSLEVVPLNDEGKLRMSAAEKYVIEVRSTGPDLLVYARMQLISVMGVIADLIPVDPNSEPVLAEAKMIEQLVGAAPGACRLM